jgi:hypothetical protein
MTQPERCRTSFHSLSHARDLARSRNVTLGGPSDYAVIRVCSSVPIEMTLMTMAAAMA